ncbi:MAG TPA: hypothetical protein PK926_13175 [Spirochaetota bacterium]|nr:hypothetical protein [Spirochaetota bacterium]HPI89985.1 hypothetical protein [Spirochaetota bacterium]HPR48420.1 hypothetical protein [Spirochaetota bacterium]
MSNKFSIFFVAILIIVVSAMPSYQQLYDTGQPEAQYTVKEVTATISMVEQELDGVKKSIAGQIAEKDIEIIEKGIIKARKYLEKNQVDEAYYQIKIAGSYFSKIEARLELYYSKQIYDNTILKTGK